MKKWLTSAPDSYWKHMLKLQTPVDAGTSGVGVSYSDRILVVGSCFADNIGSKMLNAGFSAAVNPFGTLYNPVSVCNSLRRLGSGIPFSEDDCVEMGAGSGLVCSFSHHTSFARPAAADFLAAANGSLSAASEFFKTADRVLVTLGTAWCYRYAATGETVANCLKRPEGEFVRYRLSVDEVAALLSRTVAAFPDKKFIFTVSPIRHLKDTAHGNSLSKSILLLAVDRVCAMFPDRVEYFPAYEIVLDELRDYRFYADDMVHPSSLAVDYLWERFMQFALPAGERETLLAREREYRRSQHRPLH